MNEINVSALWGIYFQIGPQIGNGIFSQEGGQILCHRGMRTTQWGRTLSCNTSGQIEKLFLGWRVTGAHQQSAVQAANILSSCSWKTLRAENKHCPTADGYYEKSSQSHEDPAIWKHHARETSVGGGQRVIDGRISKIRATWERNLANGYFVFLIS